MASVSRRGDRSGWVVRWRDEAKQQRKKTFRRKLDADRFRAEVEHSLNVGTYVDPAAGRQTFRDYAETWRAVQPVRANTAARHSIDLERAYAAFGDLPLGKVRTSTLQAFVTGLTTDLAPGTIAVSYGTVRAVLRAAARDQIIARDPCDGVRLPERVRHQVDPLTVAQVQALAAAMPPRLQALVILGAGTGLRRGELLGLQVADVDFLRRTLRVERQRGPGTMATGGPVKTRASGRSIPVGDTVTGVLAQHLRRWPRKRTAFVFDVGSVRALGTAWRRARSAAGVEQATIHDLRHFYASALIRSGLSVRAVADRLGHGSASVTLSTYAHLWPDDEDRTRHAVDAIFATDVPQIRPTAGGDL